MRSHLPHFLPKIFYSDGQRVAEISWFDWAVPLKRGNQNWNIFFCILAREIIQSAAAAFHFKSRRRKKGRNGQVNWNEKYCQRRSSRMGRSFEMQGRKNSILVYFFPLFSVGGRQEKKIPLDDSPEAEQIWFLIDCHDVRHRPAIFFLVFFFLIIFSSSLKEISDLNFPRLAIFWFDTPLPFYGCPLSVI